MWLIQLRAIKKGSEEQAQGSEAELGPEGQEAFGQAGEQTEVFQVRSQSKGGGRAEHGDTEGLLGRWGCCWG